MESPRQIFDRRHHVLLPSIVTEPLLGFLWRHVLEGARNGGLQAADAEHPESLAAYGEPVMEHLLERLRPSIEEATGLELFPTYSFLRLYRTGAILEPHRDRPACEISVSLNLGQDPPVPWPLWVGGPVEPEPAHLQPGDALIYRGIDLEHWRERYDGQAVAQVFLHYVDRNGPYAMWRFDKRDSLGLTIPLPI